mmetsp:Transcript_29024/g.64046  ORF Transcript_29024/g.64046 Transcript_29024/m.64046 type:complete len:133 (+) Transcript_29024:2510-2908(+)
MDGDLGHAGGSDTDQAPSGTHQAPPIRHQAPVPDNCNNEAGGGYSFGGGVESGDEETDGDDNDDMWPLRQQVFASRRMDIHQVVLVVMRPLLLQVLLLGGGSCQAPVTRAVMWPPWRWMGTRRGPPQVLHAT